MATTTTRPRPDSSKDHYMSTDEGTPRGPVKPPRDNGGDGDGASFLNPVISGKHILAARGELGYTGANTPIFERFFAGGFRTLRGFDFRGVSPTDLGVEVGGDFLMLTGLE